MAAYFLDSSALIKTIIRETGSAWVQSLFTPSSRYEFFAVSVARVEVVAAMTRRAKSGNTFSEDAATLCQEFLEDFAANFQVVRVTEALVASAVSIAQTYGLRGYDAVQLAAAVQVNQFRVARDLSPLVFVCADNELTAAAVQAGLRTDNPNSHP